MAMLLQYVQLERVIFIHSIRLHRKATTISPIRIEIHCEMNEVERGR